MTKGQILRSTTSTQRPGDGLLPSAHLGTRATLEVLGCYLGTVGKKLCRIQQNFIVKLVTDECE